MALFGRKRGAGKLHALAGAATTLDLAGLTSTGAAAVCFKPPPGEYVRGENELQATLDAVAMKSPANVSRRGDDLGFEWLIVRAGGLEEAVATVELVSTELASRGLGAQLLAAIFELTGEPRRAFLIYGYEQQSFWPFVPTGEKERDNEAELELKSKLERKLPIEQDLTRWLALYDAPL